MSRGETEKECIKGFFLSMLRKRYDFLFQWTLVHVVVHIVESDLMGKKTNF